MQNNIDTIPVQQGLKHNWVQFFTLVLVNAFVGGMLGMERSILPQLAETEFDVASHAALLSFIVAFGISKAFSNYFSGRWANAIGRKNILLLGWLIALPIPWLFIYANHWNWIVLANIMLGLSQGLTWSSTVVMKIDLVGEKHRGLAMGLNEFAGYLSLGIFTWVTAYMANQYGFRPYPFYLGVALSLVGLLVSLLWVKDTHVFLQQENQASMIPKMRHVFWETTFSNKSLSSITQAGLVNNLNDGMMWGLFPILLHQLMFNQNDIGLIAALYPAVWGVAQLFTGKLSDQWPFKRLLVMGMLFQGLLLFLIPYFQAYSFFVLIAVGLGVGTALVYPTFMVGVAKVCNPEQRAAGIGVFRLWRDLGYAIGALLSGWVADSFGVNTAITLVAFLTICSGIILFIRMPNDIPLPTQCIEPNELRKILLRPNNLQLIDVRSYDEFSQAHVPIAVHVALPDLSIQISKIQKDKHIVVMCGKGGGRSAFATKWLLQEGYQAQWLCGGMEKWLQTAT